MKKLLSFTKMDKMFSTLVLYISGLIIVTIIATSSILYYNFEKIELGRIQSSSLDTLSQISYSSTFIDNWVKALGGQLYYSTDTASLFYQDVENIQDMNAYLNKLRSYKSSMPYIHSIIMYSRSSEAFYTTVSGYEISDAKDFIDKDVIRILEDFSPYTRYVPIARKVREPFSRDDNPVYSNVYTYIYYSGAESEKKPRQAVIINISEQWLRKTIDKLNDTPDSDIFVIDNTGKSICVTRKYDMLSDLSGKKFIQRILSSQTTSGSFIEEVDGIKSLITYVSSGAIQWKYIRVVDYDRILEKITQMKNVTLAVASLILFISILVSLVASFRIYRPIKSALASLKALSAEKHKTRYPLKQELLKNILTGADQYSPGTLQERFRGLDIKLDIQENYLLIYFMIDRYANFCKKFDSRGRNLMRFAISNIASELAEPLFAHEPADMGDDHVVLLINVPDNDVNAAQQSIEELIKKIQETVGQYLDISLTAVLGPRGRLAGDFEVIYAECRSAARYRLFSGHMGLIHAEKVNAPRQGEFIYPAEKEKELTDALILGKTGDVKAKYMEIINEASACSFTVFTMTLLRLTFSVGMAVDVIEKSRGIQVAYNFNAFYQQLTGNEVLEEVHRQFFEMFDHIEAKLKGIKNSQMSRLADKVVAVVQEKYAQQCLSLESIADDLGMSSIYLGRQFKKLTAKSVADCINEYRIEKAAELLKTTSLPVNEISERVGFTSKTYFYPLFKKIHGVTPNEFRQLKAYREMS